jgi:tetratricopeptide (TPR) repeat protein
MAPTPFIVTLKSTLPESSWPWVIPALRQDFVIWNLLEDQEFRARAVQALGANPQSWSPANLGYLALGQPLPEVDAPPDPQLRYQAVQSFEANAKSGRETAVGGETEPNRSALLAIALYDQRRSTGSWEGPIANLQAAHSEQAGYFSHWSTAIAICFGLSGDQLAMVHALVKGENSILISLAVHSLLCQPLSAADQENFCSTLLDRLEPQAGTALVRQLAAHRPALATRLAARVIPVLLGNSKVGIHGINARITALTRLIAQADLQAIAGERARSMTARSEAVKISRQLQAELAAQVSSAFQEDEIDGALVAWQEALAAPQSPAPSARLLVNMIEAGRVDDAASLLPAGSQDGAAAAQLVTQAHQASRAGNRLAARQSARQALTVLAGEIDRLTDARPILADLENSLPWFVHLASFCQELSLHEEAQRAAELASRIGPGEAARFAALSQANLRLGDESGAVEAAHLAVALQPAEPVFRRQLASSLERMGDWEAAMSVRAELLEARFAPMDESTWPTDSDLRALASCALNAGDPEQAIQVCQTVLDRDPEDGLTQAIYGEALAAQGDDQGAMEHFQQATTHAPHQSAPWLSLARAYQRAGEASKATETLSAASHAVPNDPAIHLALGEAYLAENAVTQAQTNLRKAYELACERPGLRKTRRLGKGRAGKQIQVEHDANLQPRIALLYGSILSQLGHPEKARQVLENTFLDFPAYPGLAYAFACLLLEQGDFQSALNPLVVAVNTTTQDPRPSLDYAECLLKVNSQPDEAARALRRVLQLTEPVIDELTGEGDGEAPGRIDKGSYLPVVRKTAQALLGQALEKSGDLPDALQAYYQALEAGLADDPLWKDPLSLGLGRTALKLGQPETTVAVLHDSAQVSHPDPEVFMVLAQAYTAINLPEEAAQAAHNAVQHAPDDVDVLVWFAGQMVELGSKPEAIKTLTRAIQLEPERSELLIKLAQIQYASGDRQGATNSYRQVRETAIRPEDLHQAGIGLIELGEASAAVAAFERALIESGANLPALLRDLADAHRLCGNPERALEVLDQAVQADPDNVELHLNRADLLVKIGRPQAAQACLEHALNLDAAQPAAHLRLARLMRAQGDLVAALDHIEHALAAWRGQPPSSESADAQALAAELSRAALRSDQARLQIPVPLPENFPSFGACLAAELALEQEEEVAAAEALTFASEFDPTAPRVLSLQARLAFRRGDTTVALNTLQAAMQSLDRVEKDLQFAGQATDSSDLLGVSLAALDLQEWETGLQLARRAAACAPQEPYLHLHNARALTLRAEFQHLCHQLEVEVHAPGVEALSEETYQEFREALQKAQNCLPGEPPPARSMLARRWTARGQVAFLGSPDSLQALEDLATFSDDFAAAIAAHLRRQELEPVKQVLRLAQAEAGSPSLHPQVQLQVALAFDTLGNSQEEINDGLTAINTALSQQPNQPGFYILLARLANRDRDVATCQHALQTALALWPEEPRWHALAARVEIAQEEVPAAIHHLEQAVRLEPGRVAHHLALGEVLLQNGETRRAVRALEHAYRTDPADLESALALARAYQANGDLPEAARSAEAATHLAPGNPGPRLLRGEIALKEGDPQIAQEYAEQVLQLQPDHPQALHLLGKALQQMGCSEEALEVIDRAIPLAADPLPLMLEKVNLLECAHGQQVALESLAELVSQYPDEASILALLAQSLARSGQIEAAIQAAQRGLRNGGRGITAEKQAELHLQLGKLLRKSGQLDQAVHHLSEAGRLAPREIEIYLELGSTQVDRRQPALALQTYQKAMAISPRDPRPYLQAGLALKASRDYPGAENMLRRAADLAPDDLLIHRQLAALVALNLVHNHRPAIQGA